MQSKHISKYGLNEFVYLKTDPEESRRQIIAIQFNGGLTSYQLAFGIETTWHGEQELTKKYNEDE